MHGAGDSAVASRLVKIEEWRLIVWDSCHQPLPHPGFAVQHDGGDIRMAHSVGRGHMAALRTPGTYASGISNNAVGRVDGLYRAYAGHSYLLCA